MKRPQQPSKARSSSTEAAMALLDAAEAQLADARARYRALAQGRLDSVSRFDRELRHLEVDAEVCWLDGKPAVECVGKTNRELGVPEEIIAPWEAAARRVFASGSPEAVELVVPTAVGRRIFDCRLVPELGADGTCTAVVSVSRDITDLTMSIEEGQRARQLAEALREATMALTRSLDRGTVLATLLDRLRGVLVFDRASVMVMEDSALHLRAVFDGKEVLSLPPEQRPSLDPKAHPVVNEILTSGVAMMIPDVHQYPGWSSPEDPGSAVSGSEASWMGVPLFARGDVAGLFAMSKREPDYFKREHLELAEAMSSQASVAVENAILYEQMQASATRMRSLSRRLVEAQESERRHVARELHDEAGQALVSLRIGLRLLEREIEQGGSAAGRFAELVERTDAVMESLHRVAADLRPASLDHLGLDAALRQYLRTAAAQSGLEIHLGTNGLNRVRLAPAVETALYRVVQEAITNVVRHARATQVAVGVQVENGRVTVVVEDDGAGLDFEQVGVGDHLGLLGLRERAEALGGSLTIESKSGQGTKLTVEVPSVDPHSDR